MYKRQGLPNNIVNCTLKGSEGFVWFGTWYGLCSFDGTKFRSYDNRDGFYSADIPPRKIQRIVEDKNGFLWIKTIAVSYTHLPVAVRYGFVNYVEGDVYCDGLPLGSFRSDDW